MDRFREKFISEAHDLINNLEISLIDLESNPNDPEIIKQIFRVMHTLKGVSGMYGFEGISDITHHLETIYDRIRNGEEKINDTLFNITLQTVDHLRNLLQDEKLQIEANANKQSELIKEIQEFSDIVPVEDAPKIMKIETDSDFKTYYIIFKPNESMLFRRINILSLFEDLCELGHFEIIKHNFKDEDSETEMAWGVYLATDKGIDAIEDIFIFILDDCRILKVSDYNLFNHDDFIKKIQQPLEAKSKTVKNQTEDIKEKSKQSKKKEEPSPKVDEKIKDEKTKDENNDIEIPSNNGQAEVKNLGKKITSRINVESHKLDKLMYLVSELVTTKAQLHLVVEQKDYFRINSLMEKLDDLSRQFRDNTLSIRLVPVLDMLMPFKRLIRDLSKELKKEVRFITEGTETELDKNMIDRLAEPIMHIIRNCIDHGIEEPEERERKGKDKVGLIKLSAYYSGANVYIQIQDDGAGLNTEKIKEKAIEKGWLSQGDVVPQKTLYEFLFKPGFSTAKRVTEISGRGVGMDIVKKKISEIRGEIEIDSEVNTGTTFTIKLNQTISIIDTLLVQVSRSHFLIPLNEIESCEQEDSTFIFNNQNKRVHIDNELIPYIYLRSEFSLNGSKSPQKQKLIVINKNNKRIALIADKIIGEHQAVLKPLGDMFKSQEYLSGASILGDGNLALMLDTNKLMKIYMQ